MKEDVSYEIWSQFVSPYHDKPFLRHSGKDEGVARAQYAQLVATFPHISVSLVKVTRKALEQHHGEV